MHYEVKGQFNNIYGEPLIGSGTTIGSFCDIGPCEIGRNCKIQSFVFIPSGVTIGEEVFIGPRVTFTNDKLPPSGGKHWGKTFVGNHVSIGASVTILPGVTIGEHAVIGAGAVVTKDVEPFSVVVGVPAKKLIK